MMSVLFKCKWLLIVAFSLTGCSSGSEKHQDTASAKKIKFSSQMRIACEPTEELKELLELHNKARRKRNRCDGKRARKAKALTYSCLLANASWQHANDMSTNSYLAHKNRDGLSIGQRATKSGYIWRRVGENIARGFSSARVANKVWLDSKGHCKNIMNPSYTEMGAAIVGEHWVVMFGSR